KLDNDHNRKYKRKMEREVAELQRKLTERNRFIISQLQQSKINGIECDNNCVDSIQNDVNLNQAHHGGQVSKLYCQDIAKACIKTHTSSRKMQTILKTDIAKACIKTHTSSRKMQTILKTVTNYAVPSRTSCINVLNEEIGRCSDKIRIDIDTFKKDFCIPFDAKSARGYNNNIVEFLSVRLTSDGFSKMIALRTLTNSKKYENTLSEQWRNDYKELYEMVNCYKTLRKYNSDPKINFKKPCNISNARWNNRSIYYLKALILNLDRTEIMIEACNFIAYKIAFWEPLEYCLGPVISPKYPKAYYCLIKLYSLCIYLSPMRYAKDLLH
ncbi:hypothetical protein A3Q56_08004, partial [Intoshia linei]